MGKFVTAILHKFVAWAEWLLLVFKQIFIDVWNLGTDLICWVMDSLLDVAIAALDAIDFPFDPQTYYALIPAEAANMLGYVKVPQAISIVVAALVIRVILQTIPFVRWGS